MLPHVRQGNEHPPNEHGPAFGALARVGVVGPCALRARDGAEGARLVDNEISYVHRMIELAHRVGTAFGAAA